MDDRAAELIESVLVCGEATADILGLTLAAAEHTMTPADIAMTRDVILTWRRVQIMARETIPLLADA